MWKNGTCDFCNKVRRVKAAYRDGSGAICFFCLKEHDRKRYFNMDEGRYMHEYEKEAR